MMSIGVILFVVWGKGIMVLVFLLLAAVGIIVVAIVHYKRKVNRAKRFLEKYPDAAIVYHPALSFEKSSVVRIKSVNGEDIISISREFRGQKRKGIYLEPGKNILEISCVESTDFVIVTRRRTYHIDMCVSVAPSCEYQIDFDSSNKQFTFCLVRKQGQVDFTRNFSLTGSPQQTDSQDSNFNQDEPESID